MKVASLVITFPVSIEQIGDNAVRVRTTLGVGIEKPEAAIQNHKAVQEGFRLSERQMERIYEELNFLALEQCVRQGIQISVED